LGHLATINIDWKLLGTALGLVLVIEGMPYFLFAEKMPRMLRTLAATAPRSLRIFGAAAMLTGLALIGLVRG
jgi:uncharacterized protein